ncbi:MAG: hypothetical protein E7378_02335 [Clostridiales bacterium]|nr:hypothetical protein [Clostridiales bacterium]
MKKLKILLNNNTNMLLDESLKQVGKTLGDLSKENIIIVPDKLSLQTEKRIFEVLNIDAYFNLSVMGISKFISLILKNNGLDYLTCSNLEAKLLTLKAIQNTSDSFKCFSKKYTLGFVDEIFAKIEQIKSSDVEIESLIDEKASVGTILKFEDLKLIYKEYEKLRNGKLDSGAMLTIFNEVSNESEYLKNCNVYFVGFDSLTKQGLQVLKNVVLNSNFSFVAITAPKAQNNARLFDQSFLQSVLDMCKAENFEAECIWSESVFESNDKHLLLNNLFSRKNSFDFDNNYYQITAANTKAEEIDLCVKNINYLLKTENVKFNKIAICADASYHQLLSAKLNNIGIDNFCDSAISLVNLEPIKFLLNYYKYAITKNKKYLIAIINNDYLDLDQNSKKLFLTLINKYGKLSYIKNEKELPEEIINLICEFDQLESNFDTFDQNLIFLQKIAEKHNIFAKNMQKIDNFNNIGEITLQKIYDQIADKYDKIIEEISKVFAGQKIDKNDFCEIFEKALKDTQIISVPSATNQIFIGDLKSFYCNFDYIYILGLNQGVMPNILNDYGLITDKEILSETIKAKLEPTTKIINKRNKLKLFEIFLSANKKAILSYHNLNEDSKALQICELVEELGFLFNNKIKNAFEMTLLDCDDDNKINFNIIDNYNANLMISENQNNASNAIIKFALADLNKIYLKPAKVVCDLDYCKLFFKNNRASISIIEKFNACPHAAFLANGLKLQPTKKDKIEANIIGTFIHQVGEVFVVEQKQNLGKLTDDQISKIVDKIILEMLEDEDYYTLTLEENKYVLKLLKQEGKRFCGFINYEQTVSNFKPMYEEKYFGGLGKFKAIEIEVLGKKYEISGFVDRIDVCEDYFRIIDYKTGNTTNASGASHLYYGTKIQLFVYARAIENNMSQKLFGAFYLPIKNSFSKQGESAYYYSGFFENNVNMFLNSDSNVTTENSKSALLGAGLTKPDKNGEIKISRQQACVLTEQELKAFCDYAVELVKVSIKDIASGFIDCSPIDDKCDRCEFASVCQMSKNENIKRHKNQEVKREHFVELKYE